MAVISRSVAMTAAALLATTVLLAAADVPRPSQNASVSQRVGVTDITINYCRPGVKGRPIFGGLIAYDQVWRTGANEATTITFNDEVSIGGHKLPAGTYSLHTIPTKSEWTIIFNKVAGQWGSFEYDPEQDALRIKVPVRHEEHQEWMLFMFPVVTAQSAEVLLRWDDVSVSFTVDVDVLTTTMAHLRRAVASSPNDWKTLLAAAEFASEHEGTLDEALGWAKRSAAIHEDYDNLCVQAAILARQQKKDEAVAAARKAIDLAERSGGAVDSSEATALLASLEPTH